MTMRQFLTCFLFIVFCPVIQLQAQDQNVIKELKSLTLENDSLARETKRWHSEVKNLTASNLELNKQLEQLKKVEIERDTLRNSLKKVNKDLDQLKLAQEGLVKDKERLAQRNQTLEQESEKSKGNCKAENETLKAQLASLSKLQTRCDSLDLVHKNLIAQFNALESKSMKCANDLEAYMKKNGDLNFEISKLNSERDRLRKDSVKTADKVLTITNSSNQLSQQLAQERSALAESRGFLNLGINIATESTLKSSCYDVARAEKLIKLLESMGHLPDPNTRQKMVADLHQYIQLASSMEACIRVLSAPYNKLTNDNALLSLRNLKTFCPQQNDDIVAYTDLLKEYCAKSQYVYIQCDAASKYMPDFPQKAKEKVQDTLNKTDDRYRYLEGELRKKLQSPGSSCLRQTDCN